MILEFGFITRLTYARAHLPWPMLCLAVASVKDTTDGSSVALTPGEQKLQQRLRSWQIISSTTELTGRKGNLAGSQLCRTELPIPGLTWNPGLRPLTKLIS